ncbi:hypothetical protein K503DRAFT_776401 [Rhizopogon vinicolor AM-OR11-026]|uniref:Uncharacterized protein n=1 Tax=Rhizopogon vinicolor AM-OR11-026 TaxID=1314800 RepID=A0A1B7MJD1_9AGAM|nr:hypothetical protein K503DRAFT_776401 [Rhizopogon vinicolor AM-OR11-026]
MVVACTCTSLLLASTIRLGPAIPFFAASIVRMCRNGSSSSKYCAVSVRFRLQI